MLYYIQGIRDTAEAHDRISAKAFAAAQFALLRGRPEQEPIEDDWLDTEMIIMRLEQQHGGQVGLTDGSIRAYGGEAAAEAIEKEMVR